jgi:cation diffusion facilitator CzcD-associated flavoprotein CzcO
MEHFDVVIIGAGLSGIDGACRLQTECPDRSYVILEGRDSIGGTWDLFRYPGIRSDSDMFTLGYPFRPWTDARAIADGPSILEYIRATAADYGVEKHIRYGHHVTDASWSTFDNRWTVEATTGTHGEPVRYTANFLYLCSGYYNYEGGYRPDFPGVETFNGPVIHPQQWPEDLDYRDQRVVIIGSGATAVTLAPAMSAAAAHVTMLQRSPSWVVSVPGVDPLWARVSGALPAQMAHRVMRWKNVLYTTAFYQLCRRRPKVAKRLLRAGLTSGLPEGYDLDPDFNPRYDPWDQRMCLVPDGDLFEAIKSGKVSMVTDQIERFTPDGIRLESGRELKADLVISATGLRLVACGGVRLSVDGRHVDPSDCFMYRGFMLSGLPNLAMCFGYTNASWTLRADLVSRSVCQLLNRMRKDGSTQAVASAGADTGETLPFLDLSSGYVTRSADLFPRRGTRGPWKFRQNYLLDLASARFGDIGRGLTFSAPPPPPAPPRSDAPSPPDPGLVTVDA